MRSDGGVQVLHFVDLVTTQDESVAILAVGSSVRLLDERYSAGAGGSCVIVRTGVYKIHKIAYGFVDAPLQAQVLSGESGLLLLLEYGNFLGWAIHWRDCL